MRQVYMRDVFPMISKVWICKSKASGIAISS